MVGCEEDHMMATLNKITPCLWFDNEAEEAAKFYTSVFPKSKILNVSYYGEAGHEVHGRPAGSVMVVEFELNGQTFTGLNGGPHFKFTEAVSFQIECDTQTEVDFYWERLGEGGGGKPGPCGWLTDRFGLSWQVVPTAMARMMRDSQSEKAQRAFAAMMKMSKLDIAALERAYGGL